MGYFFVLFIVEGIRMFIFSLVMVFNDGNNSDLYTKEYWQDYTELNILGIVVAILLLVTFTSSLELFILNNICHKLFFRKEE